jgi:hypothetical protein
MKSSICWCPSYEFGVPDFGTIRAVKVLGIHLVEEEREKQQDRFHKYCVLVFLLTQTYTPAQPVRQSKTVKPGSVGSEPGKSVGESGIRVTFEVWKADTIYST